MPVYMADRDLPGITLRQLAAAQRRVLEAGLRSAAEGRPVRYIRCTFIPSESRVMCLFEASDAARVMEVNEAARFPLLRVVEVLDCPPPGLDDGRGTRREATV